MSKIKVAVIFGGASSEHEVSRTSASSVLRNLNTDRYQLFPIGIKKDGSWWHYSGAIEALSDGSWEADPKNQPCAILADSTRHGIQLLDTNAILPVDVVFPVLHGKNGEDGTLQGLLELAQLPYVGCGVLSSAVCMDKGVTNTLLEAAGIAQAKFTWFYTYEYAKNPPPDLEEAEQKLGYPIFVKPANAGSSVGISKAHDRAELLAAIDLAAKEDTKIVLEESIDGHEVECAVLGNEDPIASVVGEIVPVSEFYDYNAKYVDDSKLYIPARLPEEISEAIRTQAIRAYRYLGCRGLSRVDFFVRRSDNAILLNELNTLPGFTPISMYPKLFDACGIGYKELLDRLIDLALEQKG